MLELLFNYKDEFIILAWFSITLLLISIAVIPWIVIKIPRTYFLEEHRVRVSKQSGHPLIAQFFTSLKNMLGLIFIVLGILMLVLPVKEYSQY